MEKVWVVGDLHGKLEIVEFCRTNSPHTIYLGDILDSYDRPPIDQIETLVKIMDDIDKGKAECVFGNHEYSYIRNDLRCTGFNSVTNAMLLPHLNRMTRTFTHFVWLDSIETLITHAGVGKQNWIRENMTVENLVEKLEVAIYNRDSWFYQIGRARNGYSEIGGPLWLDWELEFVPVPEIKQIVGHSAIHNRTMLARDGWEFLRESWIRKSPNGDLNIDCLDRASQIIEIDLITGHRRVIFL